MIAALFVQKNGVYFGLPDVDPWDEERDATKYAGPWPVVAHPPCARWGTLAYVNRARYGIPLGSDGGKFAYALAAVERWGGVLEHPRNSLAWQWFGLQQPKRYCWTRDFAGRWTTEVAQRNYGHRALKWTWLVAVGMLPPALDWSDPAAPLAWVSSDRPRAELAAKGIEYMCKRESARTPEPFRDLLISIAASALRREAA